MELLSPAGGWEAMVAAVQNGADAVYMGFGGLNARRSARNFTDEEFREAVAYCHLRGVKVYLTLNTLVTDRELPAAAEALKKASDMGVDAILIQDWGIWRLAREIAPDVPLHASTQMSLHTLGGACRAIGGLRPALPPALRRQRKGRRRPSPEPEGRQPGGLCAGAGTDGRGVPEAGGPHEAVGICGGDHGDLSPSAG